MIRVDWVECCDRASKIFLNSLFPERFAARCLRSYAWQHEQAALTIEVVAAAALGILKLVTVPLTALTGTVFLPIKGVFAAVQEKKGSRVIAFLSHVLAAFFSLLVTVCVISALFVTIFVSPAAVYCLIGLCAALGCCSTLVQLHHEAFPNLA